MSKVTLYALEMTIKVFKKIRQYMHLNYKLLVFNMFSFLNSFGEIFKKKFKGMNVYVFFLRWSKLLLFIYVWTFVM